MSNRRRGWLIFLAGFACGGAAVVLLAAYLWVRPPLMKEEGWTVSYTVDGVSNADGVVYTSILPWETRLIHLPEVPLRGGGWNYQWFRWNDHLRTVGLFSAPEKTMFGYATSHDLHPGILLEEPKIGDGWKVDYSGRFPRFSNGHIAVEIARDVGS